MFKVMIFVITSTVLIFADGPVMKTGQTMEYKAGDDGTYQTGIARSYSRNAAGVVSSNNTALEWQDIYPNMLPGEVYQDNWSGAIAYCDGLELDGKMDWRLPSIEELISITDKSRADPSIDPIFQVAKSNVCWSYTTHAKDTSKAWLLHFHRATDYAFDKTYSLYVRCVRDKK